ncbi:MAG: hypothetical protein ABS28_01645 [Cryomorphaceae bacterium BACL22 MAG-120619-bin32]|nr:MAG: hypothetical protein ABS28_01645 [Cryomorphaceae bacterium BACL22 MAG-120619-bin32]
MSVCVLSENIQITHNYDKKIVLQLLTVVFVFSFSAETLAQSKKKKKDDKEAVVNSATKPSFE